MAQNNDPNVRMHDLMKIIDMGLDLWVGKNALRHNIPITITNMVDKVDIKVRDMDHTDYSGDDWHSGIECHIYLLD